VNRALTIVELLLALALLSVLTVAGVSWARLALRAGFDTADTLAWESAAHATLDLISDDLTTGDIALQGAAGGPRVEVTPTELRIRARLAASGSEPLVRIYRLDPESQTLDRIEVGGAGRADRSLRGRLLLGNIRTFGRTIDPDFRTLTVTITNVAGRTESRTYFLR